jgi:hypothetical protein
MTPSINFISPRLSQIIIFRISSATKSQRHEEMIRSLIKNHIIILVTWCLGVFVAELLQNPTSLLITRELKSLYQICWSYASSCSSINYRLWIQAIGNQLSANPLRYFNKC